MDPLSFHAVFLRRFLAFAVPWFLVIVVWPTGSSASASPEPVSPEPFWIRPVPGAVVREFQAPTSPYGAGHRGVDLAASRGTPVVAAGAGRVEFAGNVAGGLHVTVLHNNGLRTSYSYLSRVDVRRGRAVGAGDVLGASGGDGHAGVPVLHLGLRSGDDYLDPMQLFDRPDPADLVRLIPTGTIAGSHRPEPPDLPDAPILPGPPRLPDSPVLPDPPEPPVPDLPDAPELPSVNPDFLPVWLIDDRLDGPSYFSLAGDVGSTGVDLAWRAVGQVDDVVLTGAPVVLEPLLPPGADLARDLVAGSVRGLWNFATGECTSDAPPADGTGGSGNDVMVVAGLDSNLEPGGPSVGIPVDLLGYDSGDVGYFSYTGTDSYVAADTWADPLDTARRLGSQLIEKAVDEPDRPVDLLAHSLGGVVVRTFLQLVYDPDDDRYPPLGHVVTLSSPLEGAPLASAARQIDAGPLGLVASGVGDDALPFPPLDAPVLEQIAEGSELMQRLDETRLPEGLDMTTIGATDDVVVPADRISAPGATEVVVNPPGFSDHTAIVSDPGALREVRLALEGRPPACRSVLSHLRGELEPRVISGVEHGVGSVGGKGGGLP